MRMDARGIGFSAITCALLLGAQFLLSMVSGVEIVTVVLLCFSFSFGVALGMLSATAFSLVRCLIWGFYPPVVITYLIYYNLFCLLFGLLGWQNRAWKRKRYGENVRSQQMKIEGWKRVVYLAFITLVACVCTACFTLLDDVITPLFYRFTADAAWVYFIGSLSVMLPQIICTAVTVGVFFLPLTNIFNRVSKK